MSPLLMARLLGGLVLLALLAGAGHWVVVEIHKANERDAAVARAVLAEQEKVELARTFAEAHEADVRIAGDLATFRGDLGKGLAKFNAALTALPITREVPRETLADGTLAPCRVRDSVRYRGLFNSAVTDAAAP